MVKEQLRLNNIIAEKDRKIKSQDIQIIRLKSVLDLQTSQVEAVQPCSCDNNIRIEKTRSNNFYSNYRGNTVSLRRQPKFTKESERPSMLREVFRYEFSMV